MFTNKRVYLDHAATSFPKPAAVPEAMVRYLTVVGSNVNRSSYSSAYAAENIVFETREALRALFNGEDCKNVVFTANITTSLNVLLKGLLRPGQHVLVSSMEHNAVMRPLQQLAQTGVSFTRIPCRTDGSMDTSVLPALLQPNTTAVVMLHASNICGTLLPIAEVGQFCQEHGLVFMVDSAQTAGVFPIDMEAMHIDALAFTGHKSLLGPQGIGGFIIKEHLIDKLEPLLTGGTGSLSHTEFTPEFMPDRFEPGTMNIPGIYGLNAALNYLQEVGIDHIREQEQELTGQFLEGLHKLPCIKIFGRGDTFGRAPVVSLQMEGLDCAQLAYALEADYGIQTRVGLHCAPSAHKTIGSFPAGTVRFSFGHLNTADEVAYALRALEEISHGI